jgi:hypothetical protein
MNQSKLESLLSAYVDGELSTTEAFKVREWLDTDSNAKATYLELVQLKQLLGESQTDYQVSEDFGRALKVRINDLPQRSGLLERIILPILPKIALSGGALALLLVTAWLFTSLITTENNPSKVLPPQPKVEVVKNIEVDVEKGVIYVYGKGQGRYAQTISLEQFPELKKQIMLLHKTIPEKVNQTDPPHILTPTPTEGTAVSDNH